MTEAEARAVIEDLTAWESSPALTVAEVDRLLARARVTDPAGLDPDEVGYVPTYTQASVSAAVGMGFDMKQAKAAGWFDVKAGDVAAARSQAFKSLQSQGAQYGGYGGYGGAVGTIGTFTLVSPLANVWPLPEV